MPRRVYPLPEAFSADAWDVQESPRAAVDLNKKVVYCPLDDDPHMSFRRTHEQLHVAFTPDIDPGTVRGTTWRVVQAVEDCRIHARGLAAGLDLSAGGCRPELTAQIAANIQTPADATLAAVCTYGTGDYARLVDGLHPSLRAVAIKTAEAVHSRLRRLGVNNWLSTARVAAWLTKKLKGDLKLPGSSDDFARGPTSETRTPAPKPPDKPPAPPKCDPLPAWVKVVANDRNDEHEPVGVVVGPAPEVPGLVPWGVMTIEEPPRPLSSAAQAATRRAQDSGAYFRNPHRYLVDRMVFSARRRVGGLSVLIDASGSMNLNEAELLALLGRLPASVVGIYSGKGLVGVLRVLARAGKRVTGDLVKRPSGSSNVVDGPALDWLARQPGPRFWVSDGAVTGRHDMSGEKNREYAREVCRAAKIVRVNQLADLVASVRDAADPVRRARPQEECPSDD